MGDGADVSAGKFDGRGWWAAVLIAIFALALGLRWTAVTQYERSHPLADTPLIDEASYESWAIEIAEGDWLGDEVFFQEPLYPYWLGATYSVLGHDPPPRTAVRRIQAVLGALTAALVALLGLRLAAGVRGGLAAGGLAGGLFAIHGPAVLMPCLLLKPNLFLPVIAVLLLGLVGSPGEQAQRLRWFGVGLAAGLGALLRGNLLVMLPLIALWPIALRWCFRRRRQDHEELDSDLPSRGGLSRRWLGHGLLESAALASGIFLCLLPVLVRNQVVGGEFTLSTSGAGTNLYGGNNAENPHGRATEFSFIRGIPEHEADDWRQEAERRAGRELSANEVSRYWMGETWRSVRGNPGLHLSILWNKLRLTLGTYEVPDNHGYDWDKRYVEVLRWLPGFGWLGVFGLAGLLICWLPRMTWPARSTAVFFVLYLGTIVLTVTSMRARLPLTVMLAPLAGLFLCCWVPGALRASGGPRERWGSVAALLFAAAAVLPPVFDRAARTQEFAKRDYNLAVHLGNRENGQERALEIIRRLDRTYPGSSRILVFRAELEGRRALESIYDEDSTKRSTAREEIQSALATLRRVAEHPGTPPRERYRANAVGGLLQAELGNRPAARNLLRAALEFDPEAADLLKALAEMEGDDQDPKINNRNPEPLGR